LIGATDETHDACVMNARTRFKIAILDDYQNVALSSADWSAVASRADITVFTDHVSGHERVVKRLESFDVVCVMRERTPLPRAVIQRLPRLRLIASTGSSNSSIDVAAAQEHGIRVTHSAYRATAAIELTWALILAGSRHLVEEAHSIRAGGWQTTVGQELAGRILGVLGLGNIGREVARIALAFGMQVIAWSQNLEPSRAAALGATWVSKDELFRQADILTVHLLLSHRTRGLVTAADLALMKPTARLINTSRGPIIEEQALIDTLLTHSIAGAALDVYDMEPLPADHPFRRLDNVLSTPHIGFVTQTLYQTFYGDAARAITSWLIEQSAEDTASIRARARSTEMDLTSPDRSV
jgi:phosphoglycerate dehydrogenase-like enzyme